MSKSFITFGLLATLFTITSAYANSAYTTDLGSLQMMDLNSGAYNNAVNSAVAKYTIKGDSNQEDTTTVRTSSYKKEAYDDTEDSVDTTIKYEGDDYYTKGVNSSKTIYTDDLGRLHFFGKENVKRY